jgi:cystatin-C
MGTSSLRLTLFLAVGLAAAGSSLIAAEAPRPGGYTAAPAKSKDVVKAARFAVEAHARSLTNGPALALERIASAESQVVAGTNYRLLLVVREGREKKERSAEAVVWWQPWRTPDPYQLTSWTWK